MKHLTIKVIVPEKNDNWKVSVGKGRPKKKKNAVEVYRHVERSLLRKMLRFSASEIKGKIKVFVDYSATYHEKPMEWTNEGIYAQKNEALYVSACFLEDYLPMRYQMRKYKLYRREYK